MKREVINQDGDAAAAPMHHRIQVGVGDSIMFNHILN